MINKSTFPDALKAEDGLKELDLAICVAWFLAKKNGAKPNISDICEYIEENDIRHNINRSRLQSKLTQDRRVSAARGKPISVSATESSQIAAKYSVYLTESPPEIIDTILSSKDFEKSRIYVQALVRQINGCYQFELYDACAVLMRRIGEVLIIDAYSRKSADHLIRGTDGNLLMLSGLIGKLKSGVTYKLSRNAPQYLETLKLLGDNAAHSRNYITKKQDIDDYSQKFRILIDELNGLS